jgi:hypothetical protein
VEAHQPTPALIAGGPLNGGRSTWFAIADLADDGHVGRHAQEPPQVDRLAVGAGGAGLHVGDVGQRDVGPPARRAGRLAPTLVRVATNERTVPWLSVHPGTVSRYAAALQSAVLDGQRSSMIQVT